MLADVFKAVLIMSVVGGALALALLLLKPLTKRVFGDKWEFYIWISVIIVLILPVKFDGAELFSMGVPSKVHISDAVPQQAARMIEVLDRVHQIQEVRKGSDMWFYFIAGIWAAISMVLFVKTVIDGILLKSRLHNNSTFVKKLEKAELRECSMVGAPILFGGIKPAIYIPEELKDDEKLPYIIAHENVHLKRGDIVIKWLAALVKCVHWFNPLVYVVVKQIDEACEISCDVEATREMSTAEKTEYMRTVLEISQNNINFKSALTAGLTVGGSVLKKRFSAIRKPAKNSRYMFFIGSIVAFTITFFSVCFCGIIRGSAMQSYEAKSLAITIEENNKEISDEIEVFESEEEKKQAEREIIEAEPKSEEKLEENSKIQMPQRTVIRGQFNSNGGDSAYIYGVRPDENNCISVKINSNVQETVDIYVIDSESGKEVWSMGVPVPYEAVRTVDGLDSQKKYNIMLKGPMRNNWEIESEYMIY